ncbi:GNAT family N-acetyltransferase [Streptomyces sp. NL15-2K]|uniref:GNAT family N-acetyltransferase n=1 Tax=Streptomyces sp. NL15-2K TaxID=376149 RepID=UPI000F589D17|nr:MULTISPECIES: GNAT family N-acetyltransferase [Actinomycetes]WKX09053.1 GNAT family N-acetyltransferase [Kutzneria buriramensis]
MPRLVAPDARFRTSFLDAVREEVAAGEYFGGTLERELRVYGDDWDTPEGFARYVAAVREEELEEGRRPAGFVPGTWYWYVDGDTYLGRIQIRHRLTDQLRDYGGHIGYGVRPTARRRGHATAMLREVLPHARALGLERVLVTCDTTNTASRKVIEAGGGEFEDERGEKLRYWIRTGG